jgi:hypothetical protein
MELPRQINHINERVVDDHITGLDDSKLIRFLVIK